MGKYAIAILLLITIVGTNAFGFRVGGVVTEVTGDTITIGENGRTATYPFSLGLLTGTESSDGVVRSNVRIIDIKKGDQVRIEVVGPVHEVCIRISITKPEPENADRKDRGK